MRVNKIPIIYYHSIAPAKHPSWTKRYLTLELKYFEEHLKYFSKNGYKFVLLKDIFEQYSNVISNPSEADEKSSKINIQKISPPAKAGVQNNNQTGADKRDRNARQYLNDKMVCLTFDDGYLDNFIYVYPLLKKYNAKGTIFVNPLFADKRSIVRKTLEDYWNNKTSLKEIDKWGFLSWDEMRLMEQSKIIDIQSHTMTHTKYFVSDQIIGFHHPGADCVDAVGNLFPERLPYYIGDQDFEKLIPYGSPIFKQQSSIIAKKVTINPSFTHSAIQSFKNFDWLQPYYFDKLFEKIKPLYEDAIRTNSIVLSVESEEDYKKRVYHELKVSKEIIETELNKKVEFCCWPSGDNNAFAHQTALEIGYKATTFGKSEISTDDPTRIYRFGLGKCKNNLLLTRLKTHFKIMSYKQHFPFYNFNNTYQRIRYGS